MDRWSENSRESGPRLHGLQNGNLVGGKQRRSQTRSESPEKQLRTKASIIIIIIFYTCMAFTMCQAFYAYLNLTTAL